ncbi:MAG: hypothetical protein GEV11_16740 [Streptosporangiales bacterium]|nr:hypothetical protein [Streptosporangiales bacterium]
MNAPPGRRRLVFIGLVVVLAAVGVYLTSTAGRERAEPRAATTPTAASASTAPSTPPATAPGTPRPGASGEFDVYPLLPFDKTELTQAADAAVRFGNAYGTYRYDEAPNAYTDRLAGLATTELRDELARNSGAAAGRQQLTERKMVATATTSLTKLRGFGEDSVTFEADVAQKTTTTSGDSSKTTAYAITLTRDAGVWKVFDFQPADAGQEGDVG